MDAITFYKNHAVHKSFLLFHLQNSFNLPTPVEPYLDSQYLIYWNPEYLLFNIQNGTLKHQGKVFQVIYKNCNPYDIKSSNQIVLSFRVPKAAFGIENYVLVRKAQ